MENSDYWHLCSEVSVFQAIMLIIGYDPSNQSSYEIERGRNSTPTPPTGYSPLKTALVNAVRSGMIDGKVKLEVDHDDPDCDRTNIDETIISVQSMKDYLQEKGLVQNFFFPEGNILEGYLDHDNPYFAPKLAAAINAWKVVTHNQELLKGKTPKKALEKWLRENASQYGLTKDDGLPNETGIQEICKIANWKPEGGAAKTPTHPIVQENPPPSKNAQKLRVYGALPDLDDEIPF